MKIDKITLCNIGSYEGESVFDTKTVPEKNVILIGGKNGAGKTTLFSAIRVCLYGYKSLGYKNLGVGYTKAVVKMINDHAKLSKPADAYVELVVRIAGRQEEDEYILRRQWKLEESLSECFIVSKNGRQLEEEEIADFEKFLMNVIPTELFDLYFFDGEKIADYFLTEGSNQRIKGAFLTLCGYDTFDIMSKQFKRVVSSNKASDKALNEYVSAKSEYERLLEEIGKIESEAKEQNDVISDCDDALIHLDERYKESGGISIEEWNEKNEKLREEEKKRESLNAFIKKAANDIIPFIILKPQLEELRKQIESENSASMTEAFSKALESQKIEQYLNSLSGNIKKELVQLVEEEFGKPEEKKLDLSFEQSAMIMEKIAYFLSYDSNTIIKAKKDIKTSIGKTNTIRHFLDSHSIDSSENYGQERVKILEKKSKALEKSLEISEKHSERMAELVIKEGTYEKAKTLLEENIRKESINDISAKALIMLDNLQKTLYAKQIEKVENTFLQAIGMLMRKEHLVDDIIIDDAFNVHVYKNESIEMTRINQDLAEKTESEMIALYGKHAVDTLLKNANTVNYDDAELYYKDCTGKALLPIEKDKDNFSKGEKQILIMALYYALISLCKNEVPFIIDTPFARIDTEHRDNISEHFFSKLNGQVFILSTNEEIDEDHVKLLQPKIGRKFLLENNEDINTTVIDGAYFGGVL